MPPHNSGAEAQDTDTDGFFNGDEAANTELAVKLNILDALNGLGSEPESVAVKDFVKSLYPEVVEEAPVGWQHPGHRDGLDNSTESKTEKTFADLTAAEKKPQKKKSLRPWVWIPGKGVRQQVSTHHMCTRMVG